MSARFEGQAALVTGAAGGIGAATVTRLASEGASVLAVDVQREALERNAPTWGANVVTMTADVASPGMETRLVVSCIEAFGRLDMVANVAGVGGSRPLDASDDANIQRIVDINLLSVMRLCRAALAHLPHPGGRIVNVASAFGEVGYRGTAAYAVAKAGVAQLTRQMTADYAGQGIRVNAVAPGVIRTPMTAARIDGDAAYRREMIGTTPIGRVADPEEVAAAIAFLLSEDASFIAGVVLPVDGGWLATKTVDA
ncbi:SDR family NAD(P)-dependent oxidoreductase [Futiania mangrovi]|uniref:SDR family oxidoreductase n=1 Tax=Futiania mangrovi TaxID=2959716 RepID=A0A9J6PG88_9PROT|nr:SDR family oxidoreductase [Futiania mangrovii]MCP1335122.1 SDR family oxidoreductase [Futiania mangrovii]